MTSFGSQHDTNIGSFLWLDLVISHGDEKHVRNKKAQKRSNRKEEKSGKKADVNAKQILQEFPEGYLGKLQIRKSGIYLVMDFF